MDWMSDDITWMSAFSNLKVSLHNLAIDQLRPDRDIILPRGMLLYRFCVAHIGVGIGIYVQLNSLEAFSFLTFMVSTGAGIGVVFMPPHRIHQMMSGAYSFLVFHTWVRAYECTSVYTNVCTYVILLDSG